MHAESFSEVANFSKTVSTDGASHALSEVSGAARSDSARENAQRRSQYALKHTEALREQGLLPELALEDGRTVPPEFLKGIISTLDGKKASSKEQIHTVKKGDTVWGICREELCKANGGKVPSDHEVNRMVKELVKLNNLKTPDQIHPGDKLKLPTKSVDPKDPNDQKDPKPPVQPPSKDISRVTAPPEVTTPSTTPESPPQGGGGELAPTAYIGSTSGLNYLQLKFDAINKDKDKFVTSEEIDSYIKENAETLTAHEVDVLKKIAAREGKLEEQSNDELGDEHQGITRQDISIAEKRMQAIEYAQNNFRALDGNEDGHVTEDEINSYRRANNDRIRPGCAEDAALEFLKADVSNLEEKHNDEFWDENSGFSEADLAVGLDELGSTSFEIGESILVPFLAEKEFDKNTELVKMEDFTEESLRLFDKLDENRNGRICENELARAISSDEYTGKDAQVLAAMYSARKEIAEQSDDEWFVPDGGITKADLKKIDQLRQKNETETEQVARAMAYLKKDDNFVQVDADGNKFLNQEELSNALQNKDLTKEERLSLEYLRDHIDQIEASKDDEIFFENSGISMRDLEWFGDNTIARIAYTMARTNEAQKTGTRQLYSNYESPIECITPDAVKQGAIGDCHFEAAVASLAAADPSIIHNMIQKNGDGTYTVTFPGAPDEPINVTAPTESEMGLYNQGGKYGSWACVLEKAYGAYCQKSVLRRSIINLGGGNTIPEAGGNGEPFITAGAAMSLLTGRPHSNEFMPVVSENTLARRLNESLNGKPERPVIAGTDNVTLSDRTQDGYPDQHMYSVIAFDPEGPDGGTVTIRNPWAGGEDCPEGTFKISVKKFKNNFFCVSFGK